MKRWRGLKVYESQKDYPKTEDGDVAILVCAPAGKTTFTDNIYTSCDECGKAIMHRPHVPDPCLKLCGACAFKSMEEARAGGEEIEVSATRKTVEEYEDFLQKENKKW